MSGAFTAGHAFRVKFSQRSVIMVMDDSDGVGLIEAARVAAAETMSGDRAAGMWLQEVEYLGRAYVDGRVA
jgi:hypothetical protein